MINGKLDLTIGSAPIGWSSRGACFRALQQSVLEEQEERFLRERAALPLIEVEEPDERPDPPPQPMYRRFYGSSFRCLVFRLHSYRKVSDRMMYEGRIVLECRRCGYIGYDREIPPRKKRPLRGAFE